MQRSKQHLHSITSSAEQRLRDLEAERFAVLRLITNSSLVGSRK
jgi:hypothetical protein